MTEQEKPKATKAAEREAKLAAALRANLRRRKRSATESAKIAQNLDDKQP
jgi:hypothetical protein